MGLQHFVNRHVWYLVVTFGISVNQLVRGIHGYFSRSLDCAAIVQYGTAGELDFRSG